MTATQEEIFSQRPVLVDVSKNYYILTLNLSFTSFHILRKYKKLPFVIDIDKIKQI